MSLSRLSRSKQWAAWVALVAIAVPVWWITPAGVAAFERALEGSILEIHHREGHFVDGTSRRTVALTSKPTYLLRSTDTVALQLEDPNPLLFTYSVDVVSTPTEQEKVAEGFAQSLAAFVQPFRSLNAGGAGDAGMVDKLNVAAFKQNLAFVQNHVDAIPAQIDLSYSTQAGSMKERVAGWGVAKLTADLAAQFQEVGAIAAKCLASRTVTVGGVEVSCGSALPKPPKAETVTALRAAPQPAFRIVRAAFQNNAPAPVAPGGRRGAPAPTVPAPVVPAPVPAPPALVAGDVSVIQFVTFALAMQTKVEAALALLKDFAADVQAVNSMKALPCKDQPTCVYSLHDQTVTFTVAASKKYESLLTAEAKAKRQGMLGSYSFALKPYTPATIGAGPAFVVLFGDTPTFKAVKLGDAYVIRSETKQAVGYNVAAMMTITPRGWAEPTFGGQFQLGVSPTKDRLGIYLGAGIKVQSRFTFGGGFAYQQANKLASGLTVGQTITTAEDLKTELVFKPGFYLHITADLTK